MSHHDHSARRPRRGAAALLSLAAVFAFALPACGDVSHRYVTAVHWAGAEQVFIAYTESGGGADRAKVMRCKIGEDNAISCSDQAEADRVLNAD